MRKVLLLALLACLVAGCGGSSKSGGGGDSSTLTPEPTSERAGQTLAIYGFGPGDDIANNRAAIATATKKLTVMNGGKLERIGFDPNVPEFFILWAHANGAQLLSSYGKTAHLDDPKAVEARAYTKSLIDEHGGWSKFKTFRDTWDFFGKDNQVAKDQLGAWPMESWYWNVMAQNSPNVHVAAVPFADKQGRPFTFFTGSGWAIRRARRTRRSRARG